MPRTVGKALREELARGSKTIFNTPMRRRRPQPLLVLAFVLLMGAVMYSQKTPVTESSLGLKVASTRLKVYYTGTPPPNGWAISAIAPRDGEVWIDLVLPDGPASTPFDALLEKLGSQCPPKTDAAWSVLKPTQDIEVRGLDKTGKALAAVSCRARS
ncbi:MAG: hypothetical protein H8E39_06250 [Alphaproteobacteria bacterium]|nr:hypothetical protein [Alphaproteobacteria bacterium]